MVYLQEVSALLSSKRETVMAKKAQIKKLRKGQRCPEGWSSVELKVGKAVRRMCVKGRVVSRPSTLDRVIDGLSLLFAPLG